MNMEPAITEPLSAYSPIPNFHSADQAIPIHEMPRSPEAGYQLLSDKEKACPNQESEATEAYSMPTSWSSDSSSHAKGIYI